MITRRPSDERGHADYGWLKAYHSFSFANYHDPRFMGFRDLRVINEDRVQPGRGFGTHPHQDMEIITYVLEGALEHKDSMGNGSVIHAGDVQHISAGTGITHSEYNPSSSELVHLLQIWILPKEKRITPSYQQQHFPVADKRGRLQLVASPDGRDASIRINQDVNLFVTRLDRDESVTHHLSPDRHAWLQVTGGKVALNDQTLQAGDGAAVSDEAALNIRATEESEALLFDLN